MLKILLRYKNAPINVGDINGQTPLHLAMILNNHDIIETLLEKDCKCLELKDRMNKTPLFYADCEQVK